MIGNGVYKSLIWKINTKAFTYKHSKTNGWIWNAEKAGKIGFDSEERFESIMQATNRILALL